jgi:hypothetical protein
MRAGRGAHAILHARGDRKQHQKPASDAAFAALPHCNKIAKSGSATLDKGHRLDSNTLDSERCGTSFRSM